MEITARGGEIGVASSAGYCLSVRQIWDAGWWEVPRSIPNASMTRSSSNGNDLGWSDQNDGRESDRRAITQRD